MVRDARARPQEPRGWRVVLSPAADLWYHCLAVIGPETLGLLPAYSAEYAKAVGAEKERLGLHSTRLDTRARDLAADLASDLGFHVLHDVPLYFYGVGPDRMLDALEAVGKNWVNEPAAIDPDVRYGSIALLRVVGSRRRRLLRRLVDVMRDEWEVFFEASWNRYRAEQEGYIAEVRCRWGGLTMDLADFLDRNRLTFGTLILSSPLGSAGRVLLAEPGDPFGTLVAVHLPLSGLEVHVALCAAVKGLCHALVDHVVDPSIDDLAVLATERSTAAVRAGAMLLEFYAPALAAGYRHFYLQTTGVDVSGGTTVAAFEDAYQMDPTSIERLMQEVRKRR